MAQIIKRGDNWGYRVSYYDNHKKRKFINKSGFKRKSDAINAARELELKKKATNLEKRENTTFSDYYQHWIEVYKLGKFSANTEQRYQHLGQLITDYFGNTLLKEITKSDYQKFIDSYADKRSKASVKRINAYINSVIADAIDENLISSNFTRKVDIHGNKSKPDDLKYLQYAEASALRKYAANHCSINTISYNEIVFGLATGCRYGEITGLTWDCVDLEHKEVTINKTYDYANRTGFKSTKTVGSVRTISIDNHTVELLQQIHKEQNETFMRQGFRNDKQLVFLNNRHQIPSDTAANKVLKKCLQEIHAKNIITFHGLRHTHASILIAKGVSIDYLAERLGHADPSITSKVYIHLLKDKREEESNKAVNIIADL